jgi:hypothetical protein
MALHPLVVESWLALADHPAMMARIMEERARAAGLNVAATETGKLARNRLTITE